ncbi:hypothetical protein H696_00347 [Fonticula alba]|uniref:Uncharacterized protein n=1 Tax=Fonticula alba TaxID=691883 RepID=A0A058ZFR4_FONAL|nr:hypothetical protein H696_00347 [Fonticula alba]KCV72768.1 hypothetical protein H696_00347 [Fonticula alba]|eukprot:XP_009492469.1 hypothetical protein H696_00347 [Fonticula alba]
MSRSLMFASSFASRVVRAPFGSLPSMFQSLNVSSTNPVSSQQSNPFMVNSNPTTRATTNSTTTMSDTASISEFIRQLPPPTVQEVLDVIGKRPNPSAYITFTKWALQQIPQDRKVRSLLSDVAACWRELGPERREVFDQANKIVHEDPDAIWFTVKRSDVLAYLKKHGTARPRSAYLIFVTRNYQQVKENEEKVLVDGVLQPAVGGKAAASRRMTELASMWETTPDKATYEAEAAEQRATFEKLVNDTMVQLTARVQDEPELVKELKELRTAQRNRTKKRKARRARANAEEGESDEEDGDFDDDEKEKSPTPEKKPRKTAKK